MEVSAKPIEGYKLTSTVVNGGGLSSDKGSERKVTLTLDCEIQQDIIYSYTQKVSATVMYVDAETGKEIASAKKVSGLDGAAVVVAVQKIDGYKFKSTTLSAKGTKEAASEDRSVEVKLEAGTAQVVTFSYAKKVRYTVKHYASGTETPVSEEKVVAGYSGDTVVVEAATDLLENYSLGSSQAQTQELVLQNDESKNIVVFYYDYNEPYVEAPQTEYYDYGGYDDGGSGGGSSSGGGSTSSSSGGDDDFRWGGSYYF